MSGLSLTKYHVRSYLKVFFIFWSILLLADITIHIIPSSLGLTPNIRFTIEEPIPWQPLFSPSLNSGATIIFMIISGCLSATQNFPMLRGLGVLRARAWSSTAVALIAASAAMTLMQTLISVLFSWFLQYDAMLEKVLAPEQLLFTWMILIMVSSVLYFIGAVFYRFGGWLGLVSIVVIVNLINLLGKLGMFESESVIWQHPYAISNPMSILWMFFCGLLFMLGTYAVLRKSPIK